MLATSSVPSSHSITTSESEEVGLGGGFLPRDEVGGHEITYGQQRTRVVRTSIEACATRV
jgi:hypothetical protein